MATDSIPDAWKARRPDSRPMEIMVTALQIFSQRGFRATTLDQVAQAAGVTKGAIYHYFEGKEDLLLQSLRHWIENTFQALRDREIEESGPASARLRLVIRYMWDIWKDPWMTAVIRLLEGELVPDHPRLVERWHNESVRPAVRRIIDLIEEGKVNGEFRRDLDTEVSVQFLLAGISKVAMQYHHPTLSPLGELSSDRIIDSVIDLLFRGIRIPGMA